MRRKLEENMMIKLKRFSKYSNVQINSYSYSYHYWYVLIASKNIYNIYEYILELYSFNLCVIQSEFKFRNCLKSNTLLGVCISCYTDMLLYDMHQQHVSFKNEKNPRLCSAVVSYFSLSLSLSLVFSIYLCVIVVNT